MHRKSIKIWVVESILIKECLIFQTKRDKCMMSKIKHVPPLWIQLETSILNLKIMVFNSRRLDINMIIKQDQCLDIVS
jgi:hypothetical protein